MMVLRRTRLRHPLADALSHAIERRLLRMMRNALPAAALEYLAPLAPLAPPAASAGIGRIDLEGRTIVPGFTDAHRKTSPSSRAWCSSFAPASWRGSPK